MQDDPRPSATATLTRTENHHGQCLGTVSEIHLARSDRLSPETVQPIQALEEVINVVLVGFAVRIDFDRNVPLAAAAELVHSCIRSMGYELGTALVIWPVVRRSY